MRVLGIVGWSGSGKTTLIEALLPLLRGRGLSVSTVKHAHHGFQIDRPGKDSWRHAEAGAGEVIVAGDSGWALMHRAGGAPALADLLGRLAPCDLVLVEGFRADPHPKLEIHRPALGKPPIWPGRGDIVAVASDAALAGCDRPVLPLNDPGAVLAGLAALLPRAGSDISSRGAAS